MKRNRINRRLTCLALLCLTVALVLAACMPSPLDDDTTTTSKPHEPVVEDTTTTAPSTDEKPEPPSDPYDGDGFPNLPEDDETKRY